MVVEKSAPDFRVLYLFCSVLLVSSLAVPFVPIFRFVRSMLRGVHFSCVAESSTKRRHRKRRKKQKQPVLISRTAGTTCTDTAPPPSLTYNPFSSACFVSASSSSKLSPLLPDLNQHLARILPREQRDEGVRSVGETVEAGFAEFEFAGAEEGGEVVCAGRRVTTEWWNERASRRRDGREERWEGTGRGRTEEKAKDERNGRRTFSLLVTVGVVEDDEAASSRASATQFNLDARQSP
jgi:hypothetical protein